MDKNKIQDFIKTKLPECFDDQWNIKDTKNDLLVEFLKTSKNAWHEIRTPEVFEEFVKETADIDLTVLERNALNQVIAQGRKDYPLLLTASVSRKNQEDKKIKTDAEERIEQRNRLLKQFSNNQAKSVENIAWASEKMKTMLQSQYDKMHSTNKPYEGDMKKIQAWKDLDYREEAGVKIISLPWFWEFSSTTKSGTEYRDMDKNGTRSISNLKDSKKFKAFADTINWCEMMELSDTYKLMNMVGQQLGITDTIDEHYINAQFDKYSNINLPQENSLWRILRALYMMTGDWFVIPISVKGNMVRSIGCSSNNAWIFDIISDFYSARPFSKIGGSPSA